MTRANLMHEPGHAKSVLWENPKGYSAVGNERGGSGLGGDTCIPVAISC